MSIVQAPPSVDTDACEYVYDRVEDSFRCAVHWWRGNASVSVTIDTLVLERPKSVLLRGLVHALTGLTAIRLGQFGSFQDL